MLRFQPVVWAVSLVAAQAVAAPPTAVLKDKGLTRAGRFFLTEQEQTALAQWEEARAALARHDATAGRKDQADQAAREYAQLEEYRAGLQDALNHLDLQATQQGPQPGGFGQGGFGQSGFGFGPTGFGQGQILSQLTAQRNMVRMNLAEVASRQATLKPATATEKSAPEAEVKKAAEEAKAALAEARKTADEALKQYEALSTDASVKSAFLALEKEKHGALKLGPSPAFADALKALARAERTILGKRSTTPSRKKGSARR